MAENLFSVVVMKFVTLMSHFTAK